MLEIEWPLESVPDSYHSATVNIIEPLVLESVMFFMNLIIMMFNQWL